MGCDIHCYLQYTNTYGEDEPVYVHSWGGRINPGRNYSMFSLMAGVREYGDRKALFQPRGLPEKIGWQAEADNRFFVSDDKSDYERYVTWEDARKWVEKGYSILQTVAEGRYTYVTNPDWHSHSWLNAKELGKVFTAYRTQTGESAPKEWLALLAALKALGPTAIVVFWFDN